MRIYITERQRVSALGASAAEFPTFHGLRRRLLFSGDVIEITEEEADHLLEEDKKFSANGPPSLAWAIPWTRKRREEKGVTQPTHGGIRALTRDAVEKDISRMSSVFRDRLNIPDILRRVEEGSLVCLGERHYFDAADDPSLFVGPPTDGPTSEEELDQPIPDNWALAHPVVGGTGMLDELFERPTWRRLYCGFAMIRYDGQRSPHVAPWRWIMGRLGPEALDLFLRLPGREGKIIYAASVGLPVSVEALAVHWDRLMKIFTDDEDGMPSGLPLGPAQQMIAAKRVPMALLSADYFSALAPEVKEYLLKYLPCRCLQFASDAMSDAEFNRCLTHPGWGAKSWGLTVALRRPDRWSDEAIDFLFPWAADSILEVPGVAARITREHLDNYVKVRWERVLLGCDVVAARRIPSSWSASPEMRRAARECGASLAEMPARYGVHTHIRRANEHLLFADPVRGALFKVLDDAGSVTRHRGFLSEKLETLRGELSDYLSEQQGPRSRPPVRRRDAETDQAAYQDALVALQESLAGVDAGNVYCRNELAERMRQAEALLAP